MKKFIAGIVMSALLFMALAMPAVASNKWGSRDKKTVSSSNSYDSAAQDCSGGQANREYFDANC